MHRFYVGLSYDFRGHTDTHSVSSALADIATIMKLHNVDGYTTIPAKGYWRGNAEDTIVIDVVGISNDVAHDIQHDLAVALKQQEVLLVKVTTE